MEHPYLIALALMEQDGSRLLPLGGKSIKKALLPNANPGETGESLILQLLLRVIQKSETAPLRRAYKTQSLLLIEIPMISMQEKIPLIKAEWISSGNNPRFMSELQTISTKVWSVSFEKGQGVHFSKLL